MIETEKLRDCSDPDCRSCWAYKVCIENEWVGSSEDGAYRDYQLCTSGETVDECINNAEIWKVDQDGGERGSWSMNDLGGGLWDTCYKVIVDAFIEAGMPREDALSPEISDYAPGSLRPV